MPAQVQQGPPPLYLCQPFVKSTVITGTFKTLVTLPKYVDPNEWVGVNRTSLQGHEANERGRDGREARKLTCPLLARHLSRTSTDRPTDPTHSASPARPLSV